MQDENKVNYYIDWESEFVRKNIKKIVREFWFEERDTLSFSKPTIEIFKNIIKETLVEEGLSPDIDLMKKKQGVARQ